MKQQFSFTYPLIGIYSNWDFINEQATRVYRTVNLGEVQLSGNYEAQGNDMIISDMSFDLTRATSKQFTEWLRAGGSYSKMERTAQDHCKKLIIQHIDHLVSLHQDLS